MRYGSARQKSGDAQTSPSFFEWKPPGHPLSIQFNFAVIDQLEADVMKGFWSVPKRGAEVGGVLFGRVASQGEETTVYIDDYEPVECEYRRGPSFVLSDTDRRRLEKTLRKGSTERQVVGFYRSHTRLGLYLDQDDYSLIQNYFPGLNQVFLLVRPHASKSSVGGFFFWEEGNIHRQSTYLEFPFSRAEILKRTRGEQPTVETEEAAAPPARQAPAPPPVPAVQAPPRETVSPLAAVVSAAQPLMARVRAALERPAPAAAEPVRSAPPLLSRLRTARARTAPLPGPVPDAPEPAPPRTPAATVPPLMSRSRAESVRTAFVPAPEKELPTLASRWAEAWRAAEPFIARVRVTRWRPIAVAALALVCVAAAEYAILAAFSRRAPVRTAASDAPVLRVDRTGGYLQVNWNRSAPAIQHSQSGLLEITDGTYTKTLRLDPRQLKTGSVAYRPIGHEVTFRLEVAAQDATVSESLRVLDAGEPAAAIVPASFVNRSVPPPPAPAVRKSPPAPVAVKAQPPARESTRVQQASAKPSPRPRRRGFYDDGL